MTSTSLLGKGEVQWRQRPRERDGEEVLDHAIKHREQNPSANGGGQGWLEAEGWDGSTVKQGALHGLDGVHGQGPKSRRAGVRASIVAGKPGNAGGAKGRREVET